MVEFKNYVLCIYINVYMYVCMYVFIPFTYTTHPRVVLC